MLQHQKAYRNAAFIFRRGPLSEPEKGRRGSDMHSELFLLIIHGKGIEHDNI